MRKLEHYIFEFRRASNPTKLDSSGLSQQTIHTAIMRKLGHAALFILASTFLGFLAWKVLCQPKLAYKDKSLTSWLEFYKRWPDHLRPIVDEAVRSIGTNAIPVLLRRVGARPAPPLKVKLIAMAQKLEILRKDYPMGVELHRQGLLGFKALGGVAKDAVPQLIAIYEQNISESSQYAAASALVAIDPSAQEVMRLFMGRTSNTNRVVRKVAVVILGEFKAPPQFLLSCVTNALHDPDNNVRMAAVQTLGKFGKEVASAAPALVEQIQDPDCEVSAISIELLVRLQADPRLVVPALIQVLNTGDSSIRGYAAIGALDKFGTEAKSAEPALLRLLENTDPGVMRCIVQTLGSIHVEPDLAVKALIKVLNENDNFYRQSAAIEGLEKFGEAAKDAAPRLDAIYEQNINKPLQFETLSFLYRIVRTLAAIGPAAQKSIPSFIRRATDADARIRGMAIAALGDFHAQPEFVVPCLTNALFDPAMNVRKAAIFSLNKFGRDAKPAAPALVNLLKDPNPDIRAISRLTLKIIDPDSIDNSNAQ